MGARGVRLVEDGSEGSAGAEGFEPELVVPVYRAGRSVGHVAIDQSVNGDYTPTNVAKPIIVSSAC